MIEEEWDEKFSQETDAAWDAIHRCLTGYQQAEPGKLQNDAGTYPLNQCILGGEPLYWAADYVVRLIRPAAVADLANALKSIDAEWMRERFQLYCHEAAPDDFRADGFEYTWFSFEQLRTFISRVAPTGRAIIFTVAQ